MARENNIYNALNKINKQKLKDNIYNNTAINRVIKSVSERLDNKNINDKISSGNIIATGSGNVKNLIAKQTEYNIDNVANNTSDIFSMSAAYKKYTNDLKLKEIKDKDEKEPTVVASDPDRPVKLAEDERIILSTEDIENILSKTNSKFSINNLYKKTKPININENKYIDTLKDEYVNLESVLSSSENGIVVGNPVKDFYSMPTYELISSEYLKQETEVEKDDFNNIQPEIISHNTSGQSTMHNLSIANSIKTKQISKYRYEFGLTNVSASQNLISKVAGFISSEIDVSNCGWIELESDSVNNSEFYILDGKEEIPILPIGVNYIENEKLFYGLMPRFTVKNPNNIIVKKDGETTAINNLDDLYLFLSVNNTNVEVNQSSYLQEHEYTISYEPDESFRTYFPKGDKIRIKAIKRNIKGTIIEDINTINIYKYNNKLGWTMKSLDDEHLDAPSSTLILN